MRIQLTMAGPIAAFCSVALLASPAAFADEDAYYRLLCQWSDSARAAASDAASEPPALPTGECATPAVSKAPPGLVDPDDSGENEIPEDDERLGPQPMEPTTPGGTRDRRAPSDPLSPSGTAGSDPGSDPSDDQDPRPGTEIAVAISDAVVDSDRELRDRFELPPPDVAAGPGLLHGPVPELPSVERSPCDVPGSGCGGDSPGVRENPPVDFPPSVPGVIETPPTSGGSGIPGFPSNP